jgi:Holliday junction resolvase RusA-like endonuclease
MTQIIYGNPPSKSNCYRIARNRLIKSAELRQYETAFILQCLKYRNKNIAEHFELYVDVYYPDARADLDNVFKCMLDCLQKVNAIKNDNKCVKIVAQRFIDKKNPRIEFEIKLKPPPLNGQAKQS